MESEGLPPALPARPKPLNLGVSPDSGGRRGPRPSPVAGLLLLRNQAPKIQSPVKVDICTPTRIIWLGVPSGLAPMSITVSAPT